MNQQPWTSQDIEHLLGQEPIIRDAGFSGRVRSRLVIRRRLRQRVFAGVAALWLALFLILTPLQPLSLYLEKLRLIGGRAGSMVPARVDLQFVDLLSQPAVQLGVGFLLAASVALAVAQLSEH